ncbi:glycosyltransferase [Pantoea sp. MBD-2R]|uniref:glycosyltransferase family 32 protein n=1 Tax=unclassified Pantoea TaxID=2630326 RepID=UPI0011BF9FDD|nr:glycosyltransferase [Pantoea sp. CCBC3-3-1]
MSIPQLIHQVWFQGEAQLPEKYRRYRASWQRHHPDFQCLLWDAHALREHVATHWPQFLPVYDAFPHDVQRMDSARYCLLATLGGIYADMDIECLRPVDELLAGHELILSETVGYNIAFIASATGHPLWETVLHHLTHKIYAGLDDVPAFMRESAAMQIAAVSGPRFFTLCVEESGVLALAETLACPGDYFEGNGRTENGIAYGRHDMDLNWMSPSARLLSRLARGFSSIASGMRFRRKKSKGESF